MITPRKALHDLRKNGDHTSALRYLINVARLGEPKPGVTSFSDWIQAKFADLLARSGIKSGAIAEIGGSTHSFVRNLPGFEARFLSLHDTGDPAFIKADITRCPHVKDASFDVVMSVSVFEHIAKPWLAAQEINRILKPGGLTFHVAPFSFFYHPSPLDCFRYTPEGFRQLFDNMTPMYAEFYTANRRKDSRGKEPNTIDFFGGPDLAIDALGGWRENIHTVFAARKPG